MKRCGYCGRENLEEATVCRECGVNEFVAAIPLTSTDVPRKNVETAAESPVELESVYLKTDLPENHYLTTSTNEELVEVVAHSSEWSPFDVAHARRLIGERGIDLKKVDQKRAEHLRQLRQGRPASKQLIFFGWVFSLLGGLVGLGIG